jgi:ATP-binding cassette, subfamily B, bacterial MsbA
MWQLFLQSLPKNIFLSCAMLLFNVFAACLEGISFTFLLMSIATLTHEHLLIPWFTFFSKWGEHLFLLLLMGAILLQILRSLTTYFAQILMTLLTIRIQKVTQKQIFERIFHMSFSSISELKKGDLIHQATHPPSFIPMLFDEYNRLIVACLMIVAYLILMVQISLGLTACILAIFVGAALIQKVLLKKISKASQTHTERIADLSKQTTQSLDALKLVHIFQRQEHTLAKMEKILDLIAQATRRLKKLSALIPSLNECLGIVMVGFALLLGTLFLQTEGIPYASYLFTYLTLAYRLGTRLQHVMIAKGMLSYYAGPLQRLNEMLLVETHQTEGQSAHLHFEREICFENVSFRYPHHHSDVLKQLSLTIPKRHLVALVGISGGGKTSLIDLLLRLYQPVKGVIKLDNTPIDLLSLNNWRNLFGVVLQDAFLFNESIEENIRFGNLHASNDEIIHAAKLAGADGFIQKLPQKYQTVIGEKGHRLSGGEKQRISLAQALVRNPEILVLDEATSHLDSHSEQMIQETLSQLRKEKTLLIVAHRLSTIQKADLIFVIENGTVAETGTHDSLLQLRGKYHRFWQLQK